MNVLHVVGARPNFMKLASVVHALLGRAEQIVVHTGQHYDAEMSDVFFRQLDIPEPDVNLEIGSGSHAVQTGQIMIRLEAALLERRPDVVCVYGDVNSTMAAAIVCAKLGIRVAHVEAGLRSFDRTMPEEINRLITDQIADLLFTPSRDGDENLLHEGVPGQRIHFVGNVMIDTLVRLQPAARERWAAVRGEHALDRYALVVVTDSGGVQEETTFLGVPCLTMRENTERPVTITDELSWYSERFGEREENHAIAITCSGAMPLTFGYVVAREPVASSFANGILRAGAVTIFRGGSVTFD